jgi:hypothetical protein
MDVVGGGDALCLDFKSRFYRDLCYCTLARPHTEPWTVVGPPSTFWLGALQVSAFPFL